MKRKLRTLLLALLVAVMLCSCEAWENHKANDYWPATSNPVSQGFDKLVCLDPQSKMPQCK